MVLDNPYFAVTDDKGYFEIKNVPAGTQKVVVWQEAVAKGVCDATVGRGHHDQGQRYDRQRFHHRSDQAAARQLIRTGSDRSRVRNKDHFWTSQPEVVHLLYASEGTGNGNQ